MADVQIEHGYTRIADALYEALIRTPMPGRHKDVVHAVIRLTYGHPKHCGPQNERKMGAALINTLVPIDKRRIRAILTDLEKWGLIERSKVVNGATSTIRLLKDFDQWKVGCVESDPEKEIPGYTGTRVEGDPGGPIPDHPGGGGPGDPGGGGPATRNKRDKRDIPPGKADGRRRCGKTDCPDWLDPPGYARVKDWAEAVVPKTVAPHLDSWIDEALGYYRQEGKRFSDWPQAVINNIRSRVNRDRKQRGEAPLPTMAKAQQAQRRTEKLKAESTARSPPDLEPEDLAAFAKRPEVQALFDA